MKKIKYVKRAHQWCVSWSEKDVKGKHKQHIEWYSTESEARASISNRVNVLTT